MPFISYAQNFEDVILWRALKHIPRGFYIDVGAWSPDYDSVTRAFYECGWNGINIEPNPEFNCQLCEKRLDDINLCIAVGEKESALTMSFVSNTGLSTLDASIAERYGKDGRNIVSQQVPVTTLSAIWKQHVPLGQAVHFLKIDIEGSEEAALRGNDWLTNRPWIVVVEATIPMSQVESYDVWESILIRANYVFAYADGLNRFYVAVEHSDLLAAFRYPPNVFDEFVLAAQHQAEAAAIQANVRAKQADDERMQAESRANQAETNLVLMRNSTSWRVTAPLRWVVRQAKLLVSLGLKTRLVAFLQKIMRKTYAYINNHPELRKWLIALFKRIGILSFFKKIYFRIIWTQMNHDVSARRSSKISELTPRSQAVYETLKASVDRKREGR